ncbi:MAG: NADH-quinone oxidoreductase subunit C [Thermoplasmata archaeon]
MNEPAFISQMPTEVNIVSLSMPSANRCFLELGDVSRLPVAVRFLTETRGARLITITCFETPAYFEVLHHIDVNGMVATLRSRVWKTINSIPSVAAINPAAELIEHEIMELYGIIFEGNTRPENMILTDATSKLTPLRGKVSQLDARMDGNIATIIEHGSTTAPSKRVMKVRSGMGMQENPPLCSLKCPAKDIVFTIADDSGTVSRHPNLKKGVEK